MVDFNWSVPQPRAAQTNWGALPGIVQGYQKTKAAKATAELERQDRIKTDKQNKMDQAEQKLDMMEQKINNLVSRTENFNTVTAGIDETNWVPRMKELAGAGYGVDQYGATYTPEGLAKLNKDKKSFSEKSEQVKLEWNNANEAVNQLGYDPVEFLTLPHDSDKRKEMANKISAKITANEKAREKESGDGPFELFEDENKNPVYVKKGATIPEGYSKIQGKGVTINMPKPAPGGERENLNKLFEFKSQLTRISDLHDPKFTGRVQGLAGAAKELTGVGVKEKEVMFRQVVKDISDTLLRLRSGAQINEQEYNRMLKLVPQANLPDDVFKGRLKSLETSIDNAIKIRRGTLEESKYIAPSGGSGGEPAAPDTLYFDEQGNRVAGGE